MKTEKTAAVLACLAIVIGIGSSSGPVQHALRQWQGQEAATVFAQGGEDELRQTLEAKAAEVAQPPVDAKIDRIWKAIPGYNGLELDVEATYRKAASGIPDASAYVYRQIAPAVSLDDLGAQPIYRGNPSKKMVSLMINVAWGNEYIVPMLDTLDRHEVKATFFLDGSWLAKNVSLAQEIQKRGHELENHAYTHPNMSTLSRSRATAEIAKTQQLLKEQLGITNRWFAPPSGDFDQETVQIASERGLKTVLWTLDTVDWRKPSPQSLVEKIGSKAEPGFLILMHPTFSSSQALDGMITGIKAKGLALGTVSQTLSPERTGLPVE